MQIQSRKLPFLAALIGSALAVTALVAAASPRVEVGPGAEITDDGLHRIDGASIANAWAKPGIDLSGYTKVRLLPAEMTFRDVRDPGLDRSASSYPLDDEQRAKIRDVVREAFETESSRRASASSSPISPAPQCSRSAARSSTSCRTFPSSRSAAARCS